MERVLGPAAVRHRVGQRADHVEELGERARVGVQEQQRRGVRLGRADVDEVDGLAVDLGDEVRDGVHPRLLGAPVELLPRGRPFPAGSRLGCRTPSCRRGPTG